MTMAFALRRTARPCALQLTRTTCIRSFSVSMQLIKDLRTQSGAPIGECKKALEATSSIQDAMDWLRQHGAAKATSKLQGREASEGLVGLLISDDGTSASLVKISAETDFASRSATFCDLVTHTAKATLESNNEETVDSEKALAYQHGGKSVKDVMDEAVVAIRENLGIASAVRLSADDGRLVGYVHGRAEGSSVAGSVAAVVHVSPKKDNVSPDILQDVGKKLAMHVVAAKPLYLSPEDVPEDVLAKEREILTEQMADSGKPAHILEKIVGGKLRKFYETVCLTEQPHMVEEGNPKVSKHLNDVGIAVKRFERLSVSS